MRVLGIDPGLNGGAAIVEVAAPQSIPPTPGRLVSAIDTPTHGEDRKRRIDALKLRDFIQTHGADVCFIERAQAMPKQGSSSGFNYGRGVGALETVPLLCGCSVKVIETRAWKKHFGFGPEKEIARDLVVARFPDHAYLFARVKDHNRAEAVLIACYGAHLLANGLKL